MEYTVQVTVKVCTHSIDSAHHIIKRALVNSKLAEIIYVDSEVVESAAEEDEVDFFSDDDDMRASSLWRGLHKQ